MFSKLALFAITAFMAIFAVALPHPGGTGGITNSCNGGQVQCCTSYQPASSKAAQEAYDEFSILDALIPASGTVGLTCTPVSVIAALGQSCSTQSACCTGNNFSNGAVVAGCNPINVNPL